MRVLIVGGAGYIGSALIPELLKRRHTVRVIDLFWFGDFLPDSCEKINMNAAQMTVKHFEGFDVAIFLGGLSNDPMADFDPLGNFVANGALPGYLALLAARAKVKTFIHGGSCSVYGRIDAVADTTAIPRTFSPYGVSKYQGELGVKQQANQGMTTVLFRMGTVCGYSPRMRFDLFVNAMIKDGVIRGVVTVNDPDAMRPLLDIRDAVDTYVLAVEGDLRSGVYNLVSTNLRVGDAAEKIIDYLRTHGVFAAVKSRDIRDIRSYAVEDSRIFKSLRRTLGATIEYVYKNVRWDMDLGLPHYYNIETFKNLKNPALLPVE